MTSAKCLFILGTRPEAIKCAPVILQCKTDPEIETLVCTTSQHRELQDQVLDLFSIKADFDLNLMKEKPDLQRLVSEAWTGVSNILQEVKPDLVLAQGDTTSAFIAGLAAYYQKIPLAHIEAGLRTHDKYAPFPEEGNRTLLSHIADLHFAPTLWAKSNLTFEGIKDNKIFIVGNPGIDALYHTYEKIKSYDLISLPVTPDPSKKLLLVTCHRRENWGENTKSICGALKQMIHEDNNLQIVFLTHPNPEASKTVFQELDGINGIDILQSLQYPELVSLLSKSFMVLTDSGGLQEEAPAMGKPVLVLRKTTERPEAIQAGSAILVGADSKRICQTFNNLMRNKELYEKASLRRSPFGDGKAAQRIHYVIRNFLNLDPSFKTKIATEMTSWNN